MRRITGRISSRNALSSVYCRYFFTARINSSEASAVLYSIESGLSASQMRLGILPFFSNRARSLSFIFAFSNLSCLMRPGTSRIPGKEIAVSRPHSSVNQSQFAAQISRRSSFFLFTNVSAASTNLSLIMSCISQSWLRKSSNNWVKKTEKIPYFAVQVISTRD